jgi:hypothetical protein
MRCEHTATSYEFVAKIEPLRWENEEDSEQERHAYQRFKIEFWNPAEVCASNVFPRTLFKCWYAHRCWTFSNKAIVWSGLYTSNTKDKLNN